jgi:hypothetical protein
MHEGALYLGVDAWQSPNGYDIIGTVVYRLLDDGAGNTNLDAMPLDFVQLNKRHTGKYLARMVRYIVEKFGIGNRVRKYLCVTHPPVFSPLNVCHLTLLLHSESE